MPKTKTYEIIAYKSKIEDLEAQLSSKIYIIKLIDKKILPSLKKRIKLLERQVELKDQEINHFKMLQDLAKSGINSNLPLPF